MSDRRKSTRVSVDVPPELSPPDPLEPEYWLPADALRGTYRVRLRPKDRAALQAVAAVVLDLAEEAHLTYPDHDLCTAGDLQGAVADLYHVAGFLGYVVGYCEEGDIQPREQRLVNAAEGRRGVSALRRPAGFADATSLA